MDRRFLLRSGAALVVAGAAPALAANASSEDTRLRRLLDSFWEADLDEAPEGHHPWP